MGARKIIFSVTIAPLDDMERSELPPGERKLIAVEKAKSAFGVWLDSAIQRGEGIVGQGPLNQAIEPKA